MTDGAAVASDYLVPKAEELPAIDGLRRKTRNLYGEHILTFAVRHGKEQSLLEQHTRLLEMNQISQPNWGTTLMWMTDAAREDEEEIPEGTYRQWMMTVTNDEYVIQKQDILYGNCENCYRAMPVGVPCRQETCQHRGKLLFFNHHHNVNQRYYGAERWRTGSALALEVSTLVDRSQDTILYLDQQQLDRDGYTNEPQPVNTVEVAILRLLHCMDEQQTLHHIDCLEKRLIMDLRCHRLDIRMDVSDLHQEGRLSAEEMDAINQIRDEEDAADFAAHHALQMEEIDAMRRWEAMFPNDPYREEEYSSEDESE